MKMFKKNSSVIVILKIDVSQTAIEHLTHRIGLKIYHNAWEKGRMPYKLSCSSKHVNQLYIQMDGAMVPLCGDKEVEYKENKLAILYIDQDIVQLKQKNGERKIKVRPYSRWQQITKKP